MSDLETFRETVRQWVQHHDSAARELATEFECMMPTVDRWWLGKNAPHPYLQAQVIKWIQVQLAGQ